MNDGQKDLCGVQIDWDTVDRILVAGLIDSLDSLQTDIDQLGTDPEDLAYSYKTRWHVWNTLQHYTTDDVLQHRLTPELYKIVKNCTINGDGPTDGEVAAWG